jgi:hypothetical protein
VALVTDRVFADPAAVGHSIPLITTPAVFGVALLGLLIRKAYASSRAEVIGLSRG